MVKVILTRSGRSWTTDSFLNFTNLSNTGPFGIDTHLTSLKYNVPQILRDPKDFLKKLRKQLNLEGLCDRKNIKMHWKYAK